MKKFLAMILMLVLSLTVSASAEDFGDLGDLFGGLTEIFGSEPSEVYGVGETAELNGISVTLDSVMEAKGNSELKPSDGNIFLICEFTVENHTEEDLLISSLMCFSMKCDDEYRELSIEATTAAMLSGKIQFDQAVEAGKKAVGVVGYEVPKDWENFQLKFTPDPILSSADSLTFSPKPE